MNKHSLRVFASCALGALEILPAALWWLGAFVGFIVGYLVHEFNAVMAAVPRAYHAAEGWQPNWKRISGYTGFLIGPS